MDPWAASNTTIIDSDYLGPSAPSSLHPQLRSRKSNLATNAQVVDRHPLRSPSPSHTSFAATPSNQTRPEADSRKPSAVASEWKAISAGLAGLFGGSPSNTGSSSYQWPADPSSHAQVASHSVRLIPTDDDNDDEAKKGRPINTVETTLDRLEDWFGLKQQHHQHPQSSTQPHRTASSSTPSSRHDDHVRVLIHPVAPTDTLSSLALHYGADIQVLRKSNKLWPGDPVQIRKVIYIPVDSCKHRPPNAEIKVVPIREGYVSSSGAATDPSPISNTLIFVSKSEQEDLLTGTPTAEIPQPDLIADSLAAMRVSDPVNDFMPDTNQAYTNSAAPTFGTSLTRSGSINGHKQPYPASLTPALRTLNQQTHASTSIATKPASSVGGESNTPSVAASASAASSGFVPPRQPLHVAKVPADQLRFFASDAKACTSSSRKPGPGDAEYRPGESGIDDLLALASGSPHQHPQDASAVQPARRDLSRQTSISNISGLSLRDVDDDEHDEWKPNTWHFGAGSASSGIKPTHKNSSTSSGSSSTMTSDALHDSGAGSQYTGWNDAPPPNAIVAKAYDGGKAYQKRQAQKSHRLLYDLAAGLPANTGAASKWARPIQFGDSLPSAPAGVGGGGGFAVSRKSSAKGGFGKLLDDTVRGRISVEAALEGALEGVRGKSSSTLPQTRTPGAPRQPRTQPLAAGALAPPPPTPRTAHTAPVTTIDPLCSSLVNTLRSTSSGLEQRRRVDWAKGKHD